MTKEQERRMEELCFCLTEQGLNKSSWGITLGEFLRLEEIIQDQARHLDIRAVCPEGALFLQL